MLNPGKSGLAMQPKGFAVANLAVEMNDDQTMYDFCINLFQVLIACRFVKKLIVFVHFGNTVINPAMANCYCSVLQLKKLSSGLASSPNKFIMYSGDPVLCVLFVVLKNCNLVQPRLDGTSPAYEVKDVQVQFPCHELECLTSFLGYLSQASTIYFNGVTILTPSINIGRRFNIVKDSDG